MKRNLFVFGVAICFFGGMLHSKCEAKNVSFNDDLQALLDYAATTPEKEISLSGRKFRLKKPVVLDARHNGLTINGQGAIVTGAKKIEGWKRSSRFSGAWEANLKYDRFVTSLFVNGVRAQCAQTPNETRFLTYSRIEDGSQHGSRSGMNVSSEQGGSILLELTKEQVKDAFVGSFRNWVQVNVPLKSVEKTDNKNKIKVLFSAPLTTSMFRNCKYPSFVIYNIPSALDRAGEFYYDRYNSKIYYLPREGEDMTSASVEFPFVGMPFQIVGRLAEDKSIEFVKNIKINSVKFRGGNIGYEEKYLKNGTMFFLNDSQSAANSIACVIVSFARNISFRDCEFSQTDSYGLWLADGVKNSRISGCVIKDVGLGGVKIGVPVLAHIRADRLGLSLGNVLTSGIRFTNNAIYNYGRFSKSGAGLLAFDVANCKIEHNEIFDGFYTGISYGWSWGFGKTNTIETSISFNKIHDIAFGHTNDVGGIYTLGISPNSKIEGNVISNIECLDYGAWGIYNDEGSTGWLVFKNYVSNSSKGGYFMHYGSDVKVFNNIIRDCKDYQTGLGRKNPDSFIFESNIIEFSSPATVLRGNQVIPFKAGKFDKNIYFNKNGEPLWGGLSFEQWQEAGQDINSFVQKIDIDSILAGKLGVDVIGFEPIDISKAGPRGKLRKKLKTVLKNYKYPPLFKHDFKIPETRVEDNFIGKLPAASGALQGEEFLKVCEENKKRFVRIVDNFKDYKPYFAYKFVLNSADFIKVEFEARFSENSNLLLELRSESGVGGGGYPQMHITKAKLAREPLPLGKWLKFKVRVPNHVNPDKKIFVKVFDGDKLILQKDFPYTTLDTNFYSAFFIAFNGGNGEITDIAKVRIVPAK